MTAKILLALMVTALTSCATYNLSTTSLSEQLKSNQQIEQSKEYQKFAFVEYSSNNLDKIKCSDKTGKELWLYPDKNTQIVLVKKNGSKTKAYFDTMVLRGDTLFSLESRISGGRQRTMLNEVERVFLTAEFPKTKPVK